MLQGDYSGVQKELCGLPDHQVRLRAPLRHRVWNLYLYEQVRQKSTVKLKRSLNVSDQTHMSFSFQDQC